MKTKRKTSKSREKNRPKLYKNRKCIQMLSGTEKIPKSNKWFTEKPYNTNNLIVSEGIGKKWKMKWNTIPCSQPMAALVRSPKQCQPRERSLRKRPKDKQHENSYNRHFSCTSQYSAMHRKLFISADRTTSKTVYNNWNI